MLDSQAASARRLEYMRRMSAAVTQFLAPSNTLRERFLEFGIPPDRIAHAPQGIDQTGFAALQRTPADDVRFAFMGSLLVSKAPHLLLEAFGGLPRGRATLEIFGSFASYHGDDRYRSQVEPLLTQPDVHVHGPIPHDAVPAALASVDVLVVPSVWLENAPFVIREAFAAGVPVVASNIGGMAEMVADGRTGLLFQVGDAADLRRTMRRVIEEAGLLDRLRAGIERGPDDPGGRAVDARDLYRQLADGSACERRPRAVAPRTSRRRRPRSS